MDEVPAAQLEEGTTETEAVPEHDDRVAALATGEAEGLPPLPISPYTLGTQTLPPWPSPLENKPPPPSQQELMRQLARDQLAKTIAAARKHHLSCKPLQT